MRSRGYTFELQINAKLFVFFRSPFATRNVTTGRTTLKPKYILIVIFQANYSPSLCHVTRNIIEIWQICVLYGTMTKLDLDRRMQTWRGWTFGVENISTFITPKVFNQRHYLLFWLVFRNFQQPFK